AEALDRVADETGRAVMVDGAERLDQRRQVVAAEIVHQLRQLLVAARRDQLRDRALVADVVVETLAPGRTALEHQRRVELARAPLDPGAQLVAARLLERGLLQRAVFQDNHVPAEVPEQLLVALP